MIAKFLLITIAALLVSSEKPRNLQSVSSSVFHTDCPTFDASFKKIGTYDGCISPKLNYKKTYYISRYFQADWATAKAICKSFGLELATFETIKEAGNFLQVLDKSDPIQFDGFALVDGITTNLGSSSDWFWTNSGVKIPYNLSWAPLEPNNLGGEEPCLTIGKYSEIYGFNDYPCFGNPTRFICQLTEVL